MYIFIQIPAFGFCILFIIIFEKTERFIDKTLNELEQKDL